MERLTPAKGPVNTGTIPTAIPGPEYLPLLDAVEAAAAICNRPGESPRAEDARSVGGFALAVLSRWMANAQAFVLLRNANLLVDAYGIARVGSELAIMAAWAWEGGAGRRFATPAARVRALIDDGTYKTRAWFDAMHERYDDRAVVSPGVAC